MQVDPLETARVWLAQSRDDLRYAHTVFDAEHYALVCFLSQQAAEKAQKGYLRWCRGDHERTHRITQLLDELAIADEELAMSLRDAEGLDQYYVATRYPDALGGSLPSRVFRRADATSAFDRAERLVNVIERRLPHDTDGFEQDSASCRV